MKCEPNDRRRTVIAQLCAIPLLFASSAACSQPSAPEVRSAMVNSSKGENVAQDSGRGAIANLPFSQGRSFASLDEYLEFRKSRGAYDVPWYRKTKLGMYELVSRRGPGAEPQIYSREELARKFGFQQ
ncbi:MAG: hypothetical protein H0U34_06240 [Sphingomonas sp.]|nr:hypothetical protein [Sphingomonas sp.]